MIDLWFGDSWAVGCELALHHDRYTLSDPSHVYIQSHMDRPDLAFPHLVSSVRGNEYINFGKQGSSIEFQLHNLILFIKQDKQFSSSPKTTYTQNKKYTCFFCLPFPARRFWIKYDGSAKELAKRTVWKNNSDLETLEYSTCLILNQMALICKQYGLDFYFFNIYQPMLDWHYWPTIDLTGNHWLIDRYSSLLHEVTGLDKNFTLDKFHYTDPRYADFDLNFLAPCELHPNTHAHQKLADYLIIKLNRSR